jgi:hypothetical protein
MWGAGTRSEPGWSSIVVYHWFALPIAHIPEDEKMISMQALQVFPHDRMLWEAKWPVIGRNGERVERR